MSVLQGSTSNRVEGVGLPDLLQNAVNRSTDCLHLAGRLRWNSSSTVFGIPSSQRLGDATHVELRFSGST
jgi:hypothetical protein